MPALLWRYLTALLDDRTAATCMAMSEALQTVSQDRWTRRLQADWPGPPLLENACRRLFVWERGYLLLEDTVIPQPFATAMERLARGFSSQERRPVEGVSRVLRVWADGPLRIPLSRRLWRKGGPSTSALALAWLSDARPRVRGRPDSALFEAW